METRSKNRERQILTITSHTVELYVQAQLSPGNQPGYKRLIHIKGDPANKYEVKRGLLEFRDGLTGGNIPSYNMKTKTIIASYPLSEFESYRALLADNSVPCQLDYNSDETKNVYVILKTV